MPTCISWREVNKMFPCLCVAEAEELNNRLQSSKQRVSELERTLSSVSTQQKQFEKVKDTMIISRDIKLIVVTMNKSGHNSVFKHLDNISTFLKWYVFVLLLYLQHNKELEKERDNLRLELFRLK